MLPLARNALRLPVVLCCMGKKSEFAHSAAQCRRVADDAGDDYDAAEWRQLSHYWLILSRLIASQDLEDCFAAKVDLMGTRQTHSEVCH